MANNNWENCFNVINDINEKIETHDKAVGNAFAHQGEMARIDREANEKRHTELMTAHDEHDKNTADVLLKLAELVKQEGDDNTDKIIKAGDDNTGKIIKAVKSNNGGDGIPFWGLLLILVFSVAIAAAVFVLVSNADTSIIANVMKGEEVVETISADVGLGVTPWLVCVGGFFGAIALAYFLYELIAAFAARKQKER